jgi:putative Mn2+ efflux pump MntP
VRLPGSLPIDALTLSGIALGLAVDAFALTAAGLHLGRRVGEAAGRRMEIAGMATLIGTGVRILVGHLSG